MKGEISEEVYERWNREAGSKQLPERVTPKAKSKSKSKNTSKAKPKKEATSRSKGKLKKRSSRTR